jgi:hypothetical protein
VSLVDDQEVARSVTAQKIETGGPKRSVDLLDRGTVTAAVAKEQSGHSRGSPSAAQHVGVPYLFRLRDSRISPAARKLVWPV